jgi:hypothetical protein
VVTPQAEPDVLVGDLKVAQFTYLLLTAPQIQDVVDTVKGKAVLILGRFTPERMKMLDAMAEKLRDLNELPIIFNFDKPVTLNTSDTSETLRILAGLSKFVIADLTEPQSTPYECHLIVPDFVVPFFPIIQAGHRQFSMFKDLQDYDWLLRNTRSKS